jgi:hypothetical protein
VRFNSPGPRHARRWGGLIVALSIVSAAAPTATAQAVKVKPPAPTPVDTKPVSRYIPREGLLFYVESEGLEVHNEAWQKTAAFKMLTETKLGTMFEAMSAQLADKALALYPSSKMSGADLVACVKMAAQKGFAFHLSADPKKEKVVHASLVLRGAYTREHKATFARLIGTMMGASPKLQVVKKGTRTVVIVPRASGTPWAWWTEGNDVVMVVNPDDAELIGDTLDGKVPSAVEHPLRVAAARAESGFVPSLIMFIDPAAAPNWPGVAMTDFFKKMGGYLKSVDYRAGFQEDALMTVVRIKASKPRQGFLRVFDQPSFDKTKLPPLPEGLETFAVTSVEPSYLVEALVGLPPQNGVPNPISGMIADLKTNSRIDLQKDVLAHLGPKMALYMLPPLPSSRAAEGGATAKGAAPVAPSGLPGLNLAGMMGLGGASATLPRGVLIAEVKNPAAFGKALDNLMVAVNKELREEAAEAAEKAAEAAAKPDDPEPTRSKAKRKGSTPSLAPEFKPILGKPSEKIYQLQVPPASPKKLPAGLRPTLRLTGNLFAVATSADAARMALEVKPGDWTVPTDLAAAFDQLPKDLVFLSVNDPRKTTPEMLASLPGTLQTAANTALALNQARAAAAAAAASAAAAAPGTPGVPGAPGNSSSSAGQSSVPGSSSNSSSSSYPQNSASASRPGMPGMPGMPGGSSAPNSGAAGAAGGNPAMSMLQFNIEADKLPKAEELRSKMFPAAFAVVSDDQEVRIILRESFPDVASALVGGAAGAVVGGANGIPSVGGMIPGMPGAAAPGGAPAAPGSTSTTPAVPGSSAPSSSPATAPPPATGPKRQGPVRAGGTVPN